MNLALIHSRRLVLPDISITIPSLRSAKMAHRIVIPLCCLRLPSCSRARDSAPKIGTTISCPSNPFRIGLSPVTALAFLLSVLILSFGTAERPHFCYPQSMALFLLLSLLRFFSRKTSYAAKRGICYCLSCRLSVVYA